MAWPASICGFRSLEAKHCRFSSFTKASIIAILDRPEQDHLII
jgi:hypothetical protein